MSVREFVDTNVLLYLMSDDARKSRVAERILKRRPTISVQVLNECVSVATRKFNLTISEAAEFSEVIRQFCMVVPITVDTHDLGMSLMQRYGISTYDAMIVASALLADCSTLLTEDLQHGMSIGSTLRVKDPFR